MNESQLQTSPLASSQRISNERYRDRCVDDLTRYFRDAVRTETKSAYFLTVTYSDSAEYPLSPDSANAQFKIFYRSLLSYVAKSNNYHRPYFRKIEPITYSFLDVPSSKPKAYNPNSASTRLSTYHHHCIVLANEVHAPRFEALQDPECAAPFLFDCRQHCRIRTFDVQLIKPTDDDMKRCVNYASKYYHADPNDLNRLQVYGPQTPTIKIWKILNEQ